MLRRRLATGARRPDREQVFPLARRLSPERRLGTGEDASTGSSQMRAQSARAHARVLPSGKSLPKVIESRE